MASEAHRLELERGRTMMRAQPFIIPLMLSAAGQAFAASPKVAVAPFSGAGADRVRGAALRVLAGREEIELVSSGKLLDAARKQGVRISSQEGFETAAEALGVAAVLRGEVVLVGGRWTVRLSVVHRANQRVAGRLTAKNAKIEALDDEVARRLWPALGDSLAKAPIPRRGRAIVILKESGPDGGRAQLRSALERQPWLKVRKLAELEATSELSASQKAQLARTHKLDAFLEIELTERRRRWIASVTAVGPDGRTSRAFRVEGRRSRQVGQLLANRLAEVLDEMEPKPPSPPKVKRAAARKPPQTNTNRVAADAEPSPSRPETNGRALELSASLRVLGRSLSYSDDLFGGLRPYDLGAAPALRVEATFFPGTYLSSGPLSWVGLEVSGEYAIGVSSSDELGRSFGTNVFAFQGGLRGRLPVGGTPEAPLFEVGLFLGGGLDAFTFDEADDGTPPDLPSADYGFLRAAIDGRLSLPARFSLRAGVGYRQVIGPGEIAEEEWFPNASIAGLDGRIRVGYDLLDDLEIQAGFELRHYFASFDSEPGDFPVAGGAVDQRWSGAVGVAYRL